MNEASTGVFFETSHFITASSLLISPTEDHDLPDYLDVPPCDVSEPPLLTPPVSAQTDPQGDHGQPEDDQGHINTVDEAHGVGAPVSYVSAAGHGRFVEETVAGTEVGGVAAGVPAVLEGGAAVALLARLDDVVAAERGHGRVGGVEGGVLVALAVG